MQNSAHTWWHRAPVARTYDWNATVAKFPTSLNGSDLGGDPTPVFNLAAQSLNADFLGWNDSFEALFRVHVGDGCLLLYLSVPMEIMEDHGKLATFSHRILCQNAISAIVTRLQVTEQLAKNAEIELREQLRLANAALFAARQAAKKKKKATRRAPKKKTKTKSAKRRR